MKSTLRKKFRNWCADLRVRWRYKTLRPEAIYLPGCDYLLAINPHDARAHKLLVRDVARGKLPKSAKLWRKFVAHYRPEVAADIGLNYGECLLGALYSPDARLFGFEANPKVFAFASRSRDNHPAKDRITLTNALISDHDGAVQDLYVNPEWSGTASAIGGIHANREHIKVSVPVGTIDRVITEDVVKGKRLLFKLDIEGYEQKALAGFGRGLKNAAEVVGLMEFDTRFLALGGTDPEGFLQQLNETFHIFFSTNKQATELRAVSRLADLPENRFHPGARHTDLILIKRTPNWRACLPPEMSIR